MTSNYEPLLDRLRQKSNSENTWIEDLEPSLYSEHLNSMSQSRQLNQLHDEDCLKLFQICQNLICWPGQDQSYQILVILLDLLDSSQDSLQKSVLLEALSSFFIAFSETVSRLKPDKFQETFKSLDLLKSSKTVKNSQILKRFENLLKLKLIPWVWKAANHQELDFQFFLGVLQAVSETQRLGIDLKPADCSLVLKALQLVENDSTDEKVKPRILGLLNSFQEIRSDLVEKVRIFTQKFGTFSLTSSSVQILNKSVPGPELVIPQLPQATCLHSSTSKDGLEVKVYKVDFRSFQMAVKTYTKASQTASFDRLSTEIEVLRLLNPIATQDKPYFVEFYWEALQDNSVYLAMEYHEKTLESKIQEKLRSNEKFNDEELRMMIQKLLASFEVLKTIGIFHRDIKPDNILVTKNWDFRIIDFSAACLKPEKDSQGLENVRVTGSGFFMAPEVAEGLQNKLSSVPGSNEKADVFSLGMMILYLQVLNKNKLETLNLFENSKRLRELIESEVQMAYLKTMLIHMIDRDFNKRYEFKDCIVTASEDLVTI